MTYIILYYIIFPINLYTWGVSWGVSREEPHTKFTVFRWRSGNEFYTWSGNELQNATIDNRPTEKVWKRAKFLRSVTSSTRFSPQYGEYGNENGDCSAKVPP